MRRPRALINVLREAPTAWTTQFSGMLYRAIIHADLRHVHQSNPLNDYRYGRRGKFPALYLTTDRDTTLWETRQRVQTAAGILTAKLPSARIAKYDVTLQRLLDVTNPTIIAALGTNLQELTGNWLELTDSQAGAPTQWLGETAHRSRRFVGLVVPSEYPGRRNIVIMCDRLAAGERVRFVGFEES